MKLFKKGAEANLYRESWYGREVVIKIRSPKSYRHPSLDQRLRVSRTLHEAENIHEAKRASVPTPIIYFVDIDNASLVMEYLEGAGVKEILDGLNSKDRDQLCQRIGSEIGQLHKASLIHGDLTTSNMIYADEEKVFLIDFGLSFHSISEEDKGVDLHLMSRALNSTHYRHAHESMRSILTGYKKTVGAEATSRVLDKVREIAYRGRYFSERS
jgi:TP53 regulating kinase-like protein